MNKKLRELIITYAEKHGIPAPIVFGICMQESSLNAFAVRYEPHYRWIYKSKECRPENCSVATEKTLQKTSIGL